MFRSLAQLTQQPEYWHALLHPVPIWGVAAGVLGLAIALLLRSRPAQIATLAIILVSSAAGLPVYLLGSAAEDRVEGIVDDPGRAWLREHEHRGERAIFVLSAVAVLAAVALAAPARWPKTSAPLACVVLVASLLAMAAAGWVAKAGGQIRHREFRTDPLPERRG